MAMTKLLSNPIVLFLLGIVVVVYFSMAPSIATAMTKSADVIIPVTSGSTIDHADKHGLDVDQVDNCINKYGPDITYQKMGDKRVELCLLPDYAGTAIRVSAKKDGAWNRITSFVNENIVDIDDAIRFAEQDMGEREYFTFIKDCWKGMVNVKNVVVVQ